MVGEGQLTHLEFLDEGLVDPRETFASSLIRALETEGSICVYSPYEQGVLRRLAESLPHLAPEIEELMARLLDLRPVIRENIYLPAFHGSDSSEKVLPALSPGFAYSQLQVQNGNQAGPAFARMLDETDRAARQVIRNDLFAYCAQDTLAMVKIRKELKNLSPLL